MCAVGRVAHADESAGKHKSGKTRKGTRWLRTALIEAAAGASRAKESALPARFRRVLRHRADRRKRLSHHQRLTRRVIQLLERQRYRVSLGSAA